MKITKEIRDKFDALMAKMTKKDFEEWCKLDEQRSVLPQANIIKSVCECDYPTGKCEKGKICEKCNKEINW